MKTAIVGGAVNQKVSFQGYGKVDSMLKYGLNRLDVETLMRTGYKERLFDALADLTSRSTDEFKKVFDISDEKAVAIQSEFDVLRKKPMEICDFLRKHQFIDGKNNFRLLPAKNATIRPGTDFIDDDLSRLADEVLIHGDVDFNQINANKITATGLSNRDLVIRAKEGFITDSTYHSGVFTKLVGWNHNAQNLSVVSCHKLGGQNQIKSILVYQDAKFQNITADSIVFPNGPVEGKVYDPEKFGRLIIGSKSVPTDGAVNKVRNLSGAVDLDAQNLRVDEIIMPEEAKLSVGGNNNYIGALTGGRKIELENVEFGKFYTANDSVIKVTGNDNKIFGELNGGRLKVLGKCVVEDPLHNLNFEHLSLGFVLKAIVRNLFKKKSA